MGSSINRKIRITRILIETCAFIGIAFFLLLAIWTAGPWFEARFFPVASKLSITKMVPHPAGTEIEAATFTKLRDCEFLGLSWFHKLSDGTIERVSLMPDMTAGRALAPYTRPLGSNIIAGPWLVSLPLGEVQFNSFARIYHRCHNFWTTVTDFYP